MSAPNRPRRVRITSPHPETVGLAVELLDPEGGDRLGEVVSVGIPAVYPGEVLTANLVVLGPELDVVAEVGEVTERCRYCGGDPISLGEMRLLRSVARHASNVMALLEKHGPIIVPDLLDNGDNEGEFLRDALRRWEAK